MRIRDEECPCGACSKRVVGCHAYCVDYRIWAASGRENRDRVTNDYVAQRVIKNSEKGRRYRR